MNETEQLQIRCTSHEIRNQVSICEMYSEIIKKHIEKDGYKNESVENALDCIKKAIKIISNSLVDLKSMNNFEPKVCDIKYLVEEGIRLSRAYIFGKHIDIDENLGFNSNVFVDEVKFIACVVNIIKNASEAIDDKGRISVIVKQLGDDIIVSISNNGKMIPLEKQKEIFEEGYTTKVTGSGLGLHICKKNLEALNASLSLVKSDNEMTEFEIKVPVYASL